MRLSSEEVQAIKGAAAGAFGETAIVRLFGSRIDDAKRGGDIDLHFEVDPGRDTDPAVDNFEDMLFRTLEPQRVDKLFTVRGTEPGPFERIAYRDGIIL